MNKRQQKSVLGAMERVDREITLSHMSHEHKEELMTHNS